MPAARRLSPRSFALLQFAGVGTAWSILLLLGVLGIAPSGPFFGVAFALLLATLPAFALSLPPRKPRALVLLLAAAMILPHVLAWSWPLVGRFREPSVSSGRTSEGGLSGARAFAPRGPGDVSYSVIGSALGRQHAHGRVVEAVSAGLAEASAEADRCFVLGETGWPRGGRFRPHRSHRNGMSVDLFLPFEDREGRDTMPLFSPWSWFGYRFELDAEGSLGRLRVDWNALALALGSIEAAATRSGLSLERVILTPELQPLLLAEGREERLGALVSKLNERPSWWRHDEHVHLDFRLIETPD